MTLEKIVFFEEIYSSFYSIAKKYLNRGFTIYFFRIAERYKGRLETEKYVETRKAIDISPMISEFVPVYRQAAFCAHKNVDYIFDKYFSSSPSIKNMRELLKSREIENMYKYGLLKELENIYITELKINELARKSSDEIYFYPTSNFKIHTDESSLLLKNIKVISNNSLRMRLDNILTRIRKTLLLSYPVYLFLKKVRRISNNKRVEKFKVGIAVSFSKNIFLMNYLFMETLLTDDNELPKEGVLFIDERGRRDRNIRPGPSGEPLEDPKEYEKRGYNYTNLADDRETISTDLFWRKIVKRFIPTWFKSIFLSFLEQPLIIDTNLLILSDYIRWNIFADNYKIDNYIRSLGTDRISRILILSQYNVKTWFIYPDNSTDEYHLDRDKAAKKNHTFFSFMHFDNMVVYGDAAERFFRKHRNRAKKYIKTGVLHSQIVRELQEGKLDSPLPTLIQEKNLPKIRIGVFDTGFADFGPLKVRDGIRFGYDILKLLDELPDIGIIFKAAKWPGLMPDLDLVYDKLKNHERCLVFYMWNEKGVSAVEVIAESDLVISAAYTSPTAEALGAKKKAIYYDVAGTEIGDRYYFNRFPNFVAHSYEELKKLVYYWLHEITDKEFEDFLNTYVKDEIDPYLDGKALSRLRKLLRE